jgi:polyisoprenoid-binding protein YceI
MYRPLAIVALAAATLPASLGAADVYTAEPAHSFALFTVGHMGISNVWGRFDKIAGTVTVDADAGKNAVSVEVQADSVDTGNGMRDNHLKGPDFFNAKQFPTLTFTSTSWKATGATTAEVTGDLTIHGVAKPITVTVTKVGEGDNPMMKVHGVGYTTTFTIDRKDYQVLGVPGGVGDQVTITVALEAYKK